MSSRIGVHVSQLIWHFLRWCGILIAQLIIRSAVAFQTLEHIKAMPFSSWRKLTPGQKKVWTAISGVVVGGSVMKVSRLAGHMRSDPKNPGQRLSVSLSLKKSHTRNFTHNRSPTLIFHGA